MTEDEIDNREIQDSLIIPYRPKAMNDYRDSIEGKRRFANPEIYEKTVKFQEEMGRLGIAWHNHYSNECTIDFCCCQGDNLSGTNYHTFIPSFRTVAKQVLEELQGELTQGCTIHDIKYEANNIIKNFD